MKRLKRFYETVSIGKAPHSQFTLMLDGKPVRTPVGYQLLFSNEAVASAIGSEWQLQSEFVIPNTMPMNTMYMTWVDVDKRLAPTEKWDQISKYFRTDTLRFPDCVESSQLALAQNESWDCVRSFLSSRFHIQLSSASGGFSVPSTADDEIRTIYTELVSRYPSLKMTILETAAKYAKSGSVAIALMEGAVTPEEAFKAAYVDEIYQRKEWGEAEGDHDISNADTLLWLNGVSILSSIV